MKKLILTFALIFLLTVCSNSQTDWQVLNSGVTVNLYGLYFINFNTGYVCGASGTILKTTNGGLNWNSLNSSITSQLNDICFSDDAVGYCAGNSGILKTTNSGIDWYSVFNLQINKICNSGNIIFAGGQNGIYKSTDSGQNWINLLPSSEGTVSGLFFRNSNTGYGMGGNALQRKTTNGGMNWLYGAYWGPYTYSFGECYFFNSDTGFVGYSFSSGYPYYYYGYGIYKATYWSSGGSSWIQVYSSTNMGISGITFKGTEDTGYAVGGDWTGSQYESLILKTTNRGNNWVQQNFIVNQILQDVFFINSKTGYSVGRAGIIIRTLNGGVAGINAFSYKISEKFSLSQNYPNPFNPTTSISYKVKSYQVIKLVVYDILGKEVAVLVNGKLQPGEYEVQFPNGNLPRQANVQFPSGVYFYSLFADGERVDTKKMLLIK